MIQTLLPVSLWVYWYMTHQLSLIKSFKNSKERKATGDKKKWRKYLFSDGSFGETKKKEN